MCQFYNILYVLMDFLLRNPYFLFADPRGYAERHVGNNRLDQSLSNCGRRTTTNNQPSFVGTRTNEVNRNIK
jgi:hypothetical protein